METKNKCDICSKLFKTDKTLATHKNKFHKEVEKIDDEENKNIYMKYLEMDEDTSDSSSDESADEDGKYSCIFCTKKFDRKDFKEKISKNTMNLHVSLVVKRSFLKNLHQYLYLIC